MRMILQKVMRKKPIMIGATISLSVVTLTITFLFSSCGFVAGGGSSNFQIASQNTGPDGEAPKLAPRLQQNPKLADEDCSDNDRCKETCKDIYPESSSYKDCYDLNIQQVSDIEEVYYAILKADKDDLEDIEVDHLKNYLKIGLDSWRDRVIEKQAEKYDRFNNILEWIVDDEKDVVPILEREDSDSEILEGIVRGYCDIGGGANQDRNDLEPKLKCKNTESKNPANKEQAYQYYSSSSSSSNQNFPVPRYYSSSTPKENCYINIAPRDNRQPNAGNPIPDLSIGHNAGAIITVRAERRQFRYDSSNKDARDGIILSYSSGSLYYCYLDPLPTLTSTETTLHHKKLASIDDDDNKDLFLSLIGAGEVLFYDAADDSAISAFALGHKVLEKACEDSNDTSVEQCIKVFYCWLNSHLNADADNNDDEVKNIINNEKFEEKTGMKIDLDNECDYGTKAVETHFESL